MAEISIDTEWLSGEGIRGAELSATFASLRITVDGQSVTRVFDQRAKTVRDFVDVPLYPLAEWLASNWWFLAHEFENAARSEDPGFRRRHALGANAEGYAYPDLVVTPWGSRTRIGWGGAPSPWTKLDFLGQGHALVDRGAFWEVCADLVDKVVRRLATLGVHGTFLQEEWEAVQGADDDEASFCETAAGLGWDPYDLDESKRDQVFRLADELGPLRGEALAALDAVNPIQESRAITSALRAARSNGLQLRSLRPLMEDRVRFEGRPWEVGYRLAQRARLHLELDGQPIHSMNALERALGEETGALIRAAQPVPFLNMVRLVDGVVTGGEDNSVSFGLRRTHADGQRFLFCRALGEAISSGGDALITRSHTDRQQCNRAFAAEFLAPAGSLEERISHQVVDGEEVDNLAKEFHVSTQVIIHQIENHGIAQVATA